MNGIENLRMDVPNFNTSVLAREWHKAFEVLKDVNALEVPCAMSVGTRRILFQMIQALHAREILEIGTYVGYSALAFALAVGTEGRVVSVDIKDVNAEDAYWFRIGQQHSPRNLLRLARVAHRVDFVSMDSIKFMENSSRHFDFVCIDGWHEEEAVYKEVPLAISLLNPGGVLFLDDVQIGDPPPGLDVIPGPMLALNRLLNDGAPLNVNLIDHTLEGETIAVAVVTRRKDD